VADKILTDDEKDALLDGMASGEVEVQSNDGPRYAEVKPFEVGARSRIITNSYPRLQQLNSQLAGRLSRLTEQLINVETSIIAGAVDTCTFGAFCERAPGFSLIVEFSAKPLDGSALVYMESAVVGYVVESFYGGFGEESSRAETHPFTPGEKSVASLFVTDLLRTLSDVWEPLIKLEPDKVAVKDSSHIIDCVESGDTVISTAFTINLAGQDRAFYIVWPLSMVASLVPVFDGQKRDRDALEDARWKRALKSRIPESIVNISSRVGRARLTLREVAGLKPGQIISIDDPRDGVVFVDRVPVLKGRFGVHDGRYAIEATDWL
jgi:flagellar motor switch protein FliM